MQRSALLAGVAGSAALFAGCNVNGFSSRTTPDVYNPTGQATTRPLDESFLQLGPTANAEQYLYARLFHPGKSLAVTDDPDAADFAEAVADLAENEFAILTNLRVAGAALAYLWPTLSSRAVRSSPPASRRGETDGGGAPSVRSGRAQAR